jgi:hypothetical protein
VARKFRNRGRVLSSSDHLLCYEQKGGRNDEHGETRASLHCVLSLIQRGSIAAAAAAAVAAVVLVAAVVVKVVRLCTD